MGKPVVHITHPAAFSIGSRRNARGTEVGGARAEDDAEVAGRSKRALFWAVTENSNIETLHHALAQGADITARDSAGKTALTRAIELSKEEHIQVLKEAGAQE